MDNLPENERVRKYLRRISVQTLFTLPREERLKVRQEIETHLNAMIQEEVAQGKATDEAVLSALRRFGDPRKIGRNIRKAWLQQHPALLFPFKLRSRRWGMICIIGFVSYVTIGVAFPGVIRGVTNQHDPLTGLEHGSVQGFLMVCLLQLFAEAYDVRNMLLSSLYGSCGTGMTNRQRAQIVAEEYGTPTSQERTKRVQQIRLFSNLLPIVFLFIGSALLLILASPIVPVQDRPAWCYDLSEFSTILASTYVYERLRWFPAAGKIKE